MPCPSPSDAAQCPAAVSIGGIGVLGLAVSKLDSGFNEFFEDTIVKARARDCRAWDFTASGFGPRPLASLWTRSSRCTHVALRVYDLGLESACSVVTINSKPLLPAQ